MGTQCRLLGASVGVFVAESVVDGFAEPLRTVARDARSLLHEVRDEYLARPLLGVIKLTEPHVCPPFKESFGTTISINQFMKMSSNKNPLHGREGKRGDNEFILARLFKRNKDWIERSFRCLSRTRVHGFAEPLRLPLHYVEFIARGERKIYFVVFLFWMVESVQCRGP